MQLREQFRQVLENFLKTFEGVGGVGLHSVEKGTHPPRVISLGEPSLSASSADRVALVPNRDGPVREEFGRDPSREYAPETEQTRPERASVNLVPINPSPSYIVSAQVGIVIQTHTEQYMLNVFLNCL